MAIKYFSLSSGGTSLARHTRKRLGALALVMAGMTGLGLSSCSEYDLDERTPSNWGNSIYSYLAGNGNYTNMTRIIDDLGYTAVLNKTGSKTLFVADDDAFARFYANNSFGVRSYEQLSEAQKRMLLFGAMINNSYQLNYLCNTEGPVEGACMRRLSALSPYDSVPRLRPEDMPDNKYWKHLKSQPFTYCFKDLTYIPMIHFMEKFLANNKITNEDYDFLYNNETNRKPGQASVNGLQVVEEDIRCSNGFINRTEEVMTPLQNMAEIISQKPVASRWNSFLERFSAPDSVEEASIRLGLSWPAEKAYQKRFFSEWSQGGRPYSTTADGTVIDDADFAVKPMNCPGGMLVYKLEPRSYKEFPVRMGELGLVHRNEKSGTLHGLMRVRSFTQDDAHIFMREDQIMDEIQGVMRLIDEMYRKFGFSYEIELSTRPEHSIGSDEEWQLATQALEKAVQGLGKPYVIIGNC